MTLLLNKRYIFIPKNVFFTICNKKIIIKGPHGQLCYFLPSFFSLKKLDDSRFDLIRHKPSKKIIKLEKLFFSLLDNMILGVSTPFFKILKIKGVGYRCKLEDNHLILYLSSNIPISIRIPTNIIVHVENSTLIKISGIDKEKVFSFAAFVRSKKVPEPYKGKGIFYENETIKLKKGKH